MTTIAGVPDARPELPGVPPSHAVQSAGGQSTRSQLQPRVYSPTRTHLYEHGGHGSPSQNSHNASLAQCVQHEFPHCQPGQLQPEGVAVGHGVSGASSRGVGCVNVSADLHPIQSSSAGILP